MSLRSAVSNTPRSSVAASSMSVRVHRYLFGTPASRPEEPTSTITPRPAAAAAATIIPAASSLSSRSSRRTSLTSAAYSWRLRRQPSIDQSLPDFETQVLCPKCEKWVQSRIRYRIGALAWLVAFIMLLFTVFLFWIPFYVKYFKDVVHYCPACGHVVGRHTKL